MVKKWLLLFVVLLVMLWTLHVICALAEVVANDTGIPFPTEYMKPEDFVTFAGQVAFVVALVQFLKLPADGLFGGHIKTSYIVYAVSILGQVLSRLIMPAVAGALTWAAVPTMVLWAFCVAWASMKAYNQLIAKVEEKKASITLQPAIETKSSIET